ncbi:hypothetical protein JOE25_002796 [Serratia sp. PL17]|nr:hypothetical protein [Serratia sp. PL17]
MRCTNYFPTVSDITPKELKLNWWMGTVMVIIISRAYINEVQ